MLFLYFNNTTLCLFKVNVFPIEELQSVTGLPYCTFTHLSTLLRPGLYYWVKAVV